MSMENSTQFHTGLLAREQEDLVPFHPDGWKNQWDNWDSSND